MREIPSPYASAFLVIFVYSGVSAFHIRNRCIPMRNTISTLLSSPTADDFIPKEIIETPFTGKGSVLISTPGEFNHYLIKAAVFIYEHNQKGSLGVILERPTAFTLGESAPNIGVFEGNTLYTGGEDGSDTAIMLHQFDLQGYSKYIGSGIYIGGIREARQLVQDGKAVPKDFKFFFNHVEWAPGRLEEEIASGRWSIVKIPPHLLLKQDGSLNLWRQARQVVSPSSGSAPDSSSIDD